jgi:ribonuclease P protein component
MLPKKNRANKKEVTQIFQGGKSVFVGHLGVKYLKKVFSERKISFVVSKAVAKRATDRNLLKRRGYAVLEKHFKDLPPDFSAAFIFDKQSLEFFGGRKNKKHNPIQNLENEIKTILHRIH